MSHSLLNSLLISLAVLDPEVEADYPDAYTNVLEEDS